MKKEISEWFISYNFKDSRGDGFGEVTYTINCEEMGAKQLKMIRKDLEQQLNASIVILNFVKLKYEGEA